MNPMERYVQRKGEQLFLENGQIMRASLQSSTNATYSLGNRAYYFQGLSTLGGQMGNYLIRKADRMTYIIETIQPDTQFPTLQVLYIVQCNAKVTLSREDDVALSGNLTPHFRPYASGVLVYKDTETRSMKADDDGLKDQAIHSMHIPHCFHIQSMDRVCVYDAIGNLVECYRVESKNDALTPADSISEGVDLVQLSEDFRPGEMEDEATTA